MERYNFPPDAPVKPRPPCPEHLSQLQADPELCALLDRAQRPLLLQGQRLPVLAFSDAARLARVSRQRPLDLGALGRALVAMDADMRARKDGPPSQEQLEELELLRQALKQKGKALPKVGGGQGRR